MGQRVRSPGNSSFHALVAFSPIPENELLGENVTSLD